MINRATLLAALCIAVPSCSILVAPQDATLHVIVHSSEMSMRWPLDDSGREVTLVNALDDPHGFAGLELEIAGAGPRMTFTAADFATAERQPKFGVPDSGDVTFRARLTQDDHVVAEGSGSWNLEPQVEWRLIVSRTPLPINQRFGFSMDDIEHENPPCAWFGCIRNWRFPVTDSAANCEHEALWLSLYRYHPDECMDVC